MWTFAHQRVDNINEVEQFREDGTIMHRCFNNSKPNIVLSTGACNLLTYHETRVLSCMLASTKYYIPRYQELRYYYYA